MLIIFKDAIKRVQKKLNPTSRVNNVHMMRSLHGTREMYFVSSTFCCASVYRAFDFADFTEYEINKKRVKEFVS